MGRKKDIFEGKKEKWKVSGKEAIERMRKE